MSSRLLVLVALLAIRLAAAQKDNATADKPQPAPENAAGAGAKRVLQGPLQNGGNPNPRPQQPSNGGRPGSQAQGQSSRFHRFPGRGNNNNDNRHDDHSSNNNRHDDHGRNDNNGWRPIFGAQSCTFARCQPWERCLMAQTVCPFRDCARIPVCVSDPSFNQWQSCSPNEVLQTCYRCPTESSCQFGGINPSDCTLSCRSGCFCAPGFFRDSFGQCVAPQEC